MQENSKLPEILGNTSPSNYMGGTSNRKKDLIHRYERIRNSGIRSVNVTGDSRYLIITFEGRAGIIRVLDLEKLSYLQNEYSGHTDSIRMTSITSDNQAFYTASWDWSFRRFEILTGHTTRMLMGQGRSPSCMVDRSEKLLFTAAYDGDYNPNQKNGGRCWDLTSDKGTVINVFRHTRDQWRPECIDIAYDDHDKIIVTGSDDGCCLKWDLYNPQPLMEYFHFKGAVRKIALSKNYLAAACTDGTIRIHKKSGDPYFYLFHSGAEVRDVKISSDENSLYSASDDGSIKCWNLVSGKEIFHQKIHCNWIWSICLCSSDRVLVSGSSDGTVGFISTRTGELLARLRNIKDNKNVLIESPCAEVFSGGFFFTNKPGYIDVFSSGENGEGEKSLEVNDPVRSHYIKSRNLKNLVIAKIKNDGSYQKLTGHFLYDLKMTELDNYDRLPLMIR